MITFPHGKINLGLHITGIWKAGDNSTSDKDFRSKKERPNDRKMPESAPFPARYDGYHTIESVLVAINLCDVLEVTESGDDHTRISISGLPIEGNPYENLCIKAYQLLSAEIGGLPPISIYLHKMIPPGAGLGGGSADAAFMLRLLNSYFKLNLGHANLFRLAVRLGSDCPFFLYDEPMLATGTGHILEKTVLEQLQGKHLVIVVPPIHISTAWAYHQTNVDPCAANARRSLQSLCQQDITTWQDQVQNDFEPIVSTHYPMLKQIKKSLQNSGALYASLTGTGSGVYGIFHTCPPLNEMQQIFPGCHVYLTQPAVC